MEFDLGADFGSTELGLDLSFDGGQDWDDVPHADWETSRGWDLDGVLEEVQSGLNTERTSLDEVDEVFEVANGWLLALGEDFLQAGWQDLFFEWEDGIVDISVAEVEHGIGSVVGGLGVRVDAGRAAFDSKVLDDLAEVVVGFAGVAVG